MRAALLKIKNILGVEEAEIRINPAGVTQISGGNGTGKTSRIEALKSLLDGGYDATLIRNGADAGEIVLVLDDNTRIRKRIARGKKSPDLDAFGPDGLKSKVPPKTIIDMLIDSISADPVKFMMATEKERVRLFLEAMPLRVTAEQLSAITGEQITAEECEGHALEVLDRIRERVYDDRKGINRSAIDKKKHAEQLRLGLPEQDKSQTIGDKTKAYEDLSAVTAQIDQIKSAIGENLQKEKDALTVANAQKVEEIDRQISELQQQRASSKARLDSDIMALRVAANAEFETKRAPLLTRQQELAVDVARLDQLASELERADGLRAAAEKAEEESALLEQQSVRLTKAITDIDRLAADLARESPFPGAEIRTDGKSPALFVDGIAFERLNRASQVQFSLRVSRLRAGDLPLVLMDNAECLDSETFAAFEEAAQASGLQFIVTRVTDGPLEVK